MINMEAYKNYQEFLEDLRRWGDRVCSGDEDPMEGFGKLWEKAEEGARGDVFSPFLYLALAAGMTRCEALFLAALLWQSLYGTGEFDLPAWEMFWKADYGPYTDRELFYETAPLLICREAGPAGRKMTVRLIPRVQLFLESGFLEERRIPGLSWYYRRGEKLPVIGESVSLYREIERSLEQCAGRKLVCLTGKRGIGRKLNYAYLAADKGMDLAAVQWEEIRSEDHLRDIRTECLLRHALLVTELPEAQEQIPQELTDWMSGEELILLTGETEGIAFRTGTQRQFLPFSLETQPVLQDRELYQRMTEDYRWEEERVRRGYLERYDFLPGKSRYVLELAMAYSLSGGGNGISEEALRKAVRRSGGHSLDKYAKKVNGIYTMNDLILPQMQRKKLFHICQRVRNRKHIYEDWGFYEKSAYGNGVAAVFSGPPGTGKTMAAQAIAHELGMELYRVELPAVVDKYIGETEKKLNRIFEEAQKCMAVLFFDEADVLFSKRTEIKESNDKYSNMEIAFLLQKMEEHDGVSILATNYLQNFDEAFRRRVTDIVEFPMPDADLREKMWRSMIPDRLPVSEDIDFAFLAGQFQVSGSMIKNALIYGSFLAAENGRQKLSMAEVLRGLDHEMEKCGRRLSRGDYGEYGNLFDPAAESGEWL